MTRAVVERSAPRIPGTARIAPMLTTGIGRRQQHHVGGFDGLGDAGAGGGLVGADEREAVGRHLRAVAHPPLLEVDGPLLAVVRIGDDDMGFAAVVAGRQQPRAGLPPLAQRLGHLLTADSRRAASGCGPDGWPGRGRQGRTNPAARRRRRVPLWRARFRRDDPSRARGRCRRPGCTCRCRGRGRSARRTSRRRRRR